MTNYTYVKYSMAPQTYRVVSTHANGISVRTIISRLIHSHAPHPGGMNGDLQYDLSTLALKNGENIEYFNSLIIRLQQEINSLNINCISYNTSIPVLEEILK